MLREEQIDIRKQRARQAHFVIHNCGKNRVFSEFEVHNPDSGGRYCVHIRGFEIGDNACTCPDFRSNTLGTCKHIEAVLAKLETEVPEQFYQRKATVKQPEIYLHYGQQLRLGIHLPPRHSDQLAALARTFFDERGFAPTDTDYSALVDQVEAVPEQVVIFNDALDFIDREQQRRELARHEQRLTQQLDAGQLPDELRDLLRLPLYDYQLRGVVFLACRCRSILGDDMGIGKTIQTLAAVELLVRLQGINKVLVITPASVKYEWDKEIRRSTNRSTQVIDGSEKSRHRLYEQSTFYRLVNYEQVVRDVELLNAWKPDVIVLDEAQRIKNWESATSRAVKRLQSRFCMVLTGTPLENKLEELYSIVQFVDDRRLGPAFEFLHEHRQLDEQGRLVGYRNLDRIRERLAPILLRRTRAEVLSQLPARTDKTITVELADQQRELYDKQLASLAQLVNKQHLSELDHKRILACIANLRMICNSTFLIDKQTHISPKLDEFAELMLGLGETDEHKVVVFSQWETMLHEAAEVLQRLNIGYAMLHGNIPTKSRRDLLERFRTDPSCRVFLSTDAGGTGLNLQCADTIVNLELPWNPAVLNQRIARVHRLGQALPVRVIHLITRGTIEERVQQAIAQKSALFAGLFDGDSDKLDFASPQQTNLLHELRQLVAPPEPSVPEAEPMPTLPTAPNPQERLLLVCLQNLEALADIAQMQPALLVPMQSRLQQAIERIQTAMLTQPPESHCEMG